jgi:predicted type IV restriction endonuclease
MDLSAELAELQKRANDHREVLLTEEAAKNALVMPFIRALGYDVFNPAEVIPEFNADIGLKKGEKVDYAISTAGRISILIECKPSSVVLNVNHTSQLYRYFSVTEARLAILTNGVVFQFYSDVERPNVMDLKPFFTFNLDAIRPGDAKTLENFTKGAFDVEQIVKEAASLKTQSLLRKELEKEFADPSDEFVRMLAGRVYEGRLTLNVKDHFSKLVANTTQALVRDLVNERLSSALNATSASLVENLEVADGEDIITTEEEVSGFRIVQAIASRYTQPKRVVIRDAKAYCAILLDDNNRKTLVRLHFNGLTRKYIGTFVGKNETKCLIADLTDIYQFEEQIAARIKELDQLPLSDLVPEEQA